MGKFTRIPADTFEQIQTDAGILLYKFDLTGETPVTDEDIICPTTGGITAAAEPTYSDMGEDVDNCPANLLELKHLDGWDCRLEFTSLGTSPKSIRLALGAADIDGEDPTHIIPRTVVKVSDASDVWWVGDRADGGLVAVYLKRALSTSGFSLATTKAGKGNTSVTLTGHTTIQTQNEVPMEFWSKPPELEKLEITSTEGSQEGYTKITVKPEKKVGDSYKYKLGEAAESVTYNQEIKEDWTDWDGSSEIDAQSNSHITVVEITAEGKAYAVGDKEVTKNAGT